MPCRTVDIFQVYVGTNYHLCTHSYTCTQTHTHILTHSLTHTHTHSHTHIHTHTHTHTHTHIQIWSSATGVPQLHCQGIIQSKDDSILCVNLSEDNTRVVASATSGMIAVRPPLPRKLSLIWKSRRNPPPKFVFAPPLRVNTV